MGSTETGERPLLGAQHKDIKVLFHYKCGKFQAPCVTYRRVSRGLYLINISRRLNDSRVNNALLLQLESEMTRGGAA